MIRLEDIHIAFAGPDGATIDALAGVDLEVREGETLCLIGTSGSGKTTLLRTVNRLQEPTSGRVLIDGEDARAIDVVRRRCSVVFACIALRLRRRDRRQASRRAKRSCRRRS